MVLEIVNLGDQSVLSYLKQSSNSKTKTKIWKLLFFQTTVDMRRLISNTIVPNWSLRDHHHHLRDHRPTELQIHDTETIRETL